MNFHQRNNNLSVRASNKKSIYILSAAVIILIIVFSAKPARNALFGAGSLLWRAENSVGSFFSGNIGVLNSKKSLLNENGLLKEQIDMQKEEYALLDILKKENNDLKNILNRNKSGQKFLLGAVLVKPFLSPYDTIITDIGTADGVKVGDQVLADGNIYLGYVSEVYDKTSKVVLYSSPGEKVKVLIGEGNIEKEAVGLGNGNFSVELPREVDVKEGDLIVIPSISSNIFGVVEKVEFKESDSFQDVLFKNPVNIAELKWIEVLLPNKK